ncbi:response regulator [candidate division KSB1 bacterium]|nr:response regulator [candidate division KSB1 bacterium]
MKFSDHNKNRSITSTLRRTFIAGIGLVLMVYTSFELYFSYNSEQQIIDGRQQIIAKEAADKVDNFIVDKFTKLETAIETSSFLSLDREKQRLLLERLLGSETSLRQIAFFNSDQKSMVDVSRFSKMSQSALTRQEVGKILETIQSTDKFVSELYFDTASSEPQVIIALPVRNVFDDFEGGLLAEVNLKFMQDLIDRIKVGETGLAYVVDNKGSLVAFRELDRVLRLENLNYLEEVKDVTLGKNHLHNLEVEICHGIQGGLVLTTHEHLNVARWALVVEMPITEAYKSFFYRLIFTVFGIFASFILAFVVSSYLSKRITKPIIDLRDATRTIGNKGLDTQIQVEAKGEIGELANSFQDMLDHLKTTTVSRDALQVEVKERQKFEKELKKAKEEAEAASQSKSEFLANMSHEIRTPMNGVIGMTELSLGLATDKQQLDYLKIAKQSAESLLDLLNDILDFSKIEAGKLELEITDFDLRQVMETAINTLTIQAGAKNLELLCDIRPDVPTALKGDPGRLRQVVVNLIGNAIKFTEEGEIVLRVESIDHVTKEDRNKISLHFSVADTGIGIPEDKLSKIFESFSQADTSTTRKYGGTGLGLTISQKLSELMDGTIWVESAIGQGSTFHFIVHFDPGTIECTQDYREQMAQLSELKVLIVDDNQTNCVIMHDVLATFGIESKITRSGKDALRALEETTTEKLKYDLILLDFQMPEMSGFEFAEQVRSKREWNETKIIMMSSVAVKGDLSDSQKIGINDFIQKPIRQSDLAYSILAQFGKYSRKKPVATGASDQLTSEKLKILLAEDNIVNQKVAVNLLNRWGHSVTVAQDGLQAVTLVTEDDYDLIFMDVQMPNMDGEEATQVIRRSEKSEIPIIAMTAHAMKGDRERLISLGMDDYISKPINIEELKRILDKYTSPVIRVD